MRLDVVIYDEPDSVERRRELIVRRSDGGTHTVICPESWDLGEVLHAGETVEVDVP